MACQVSSAAQLVAAVQSHGIATQLYVYVLVPLVDAAPHIPLCAFAIDGSNRTLSLSIIDSTRTRMAQLCEAHHIRLFGWVSDGDHRMRKALLAFKSANDEAAQGGLQHPLLQLTLAR